MARPGQAGHTVAAPVAGQILRVHRDSAGPVAAGTPLVELGDLGALEIVVDVLSSDALRIAPGMEVRIDAGAGVTARGQVRRVEPAAFTRLSALGIEEQRVQVVAALDRPPAGLGDGFRVDARIVRWRGDAVLQVPASALFRERGAWAVYVLDGDGRARLRPVELGHRGRHAVEVRGGLAPGTRVVAYPGDRVAAGVRLRAR